MAEKQDPQDLIPRNRLCIFKKPMILINFSINQFEYVKPALVRKHKFSWTIVKLLFMEVK